MIYFTDMLLIPGEGDPSDDLRRAMAGTGMIRCAQTETQPDLMVDWNRSEVDPEYQKEVERQIKVLMAERRSEEWDSGGAWGGPGGSSEAWGIVKHEPEVAYRIVDGEVILGITNYDPNYLPEVPLLDEITDWLSHNIGPQDPDDGLVWAVDELVEDELYKVYWEEDPDWTPDDGSDEGPDDYDDYDGPGVGFPPADWDPYGGP